VDAVVLDTNIVSFLMRGDSRGELYHTHLLGKVLTVSFMTVAELYEGAYSAHWGAIKLTALERSLKKYIIIPYTARLCLYWGQIRAARKSQPISVDDAWIAATAVSFGLPLISHNPSDFHDIERLKLITEIHD
jgi:predicted nucleic acid-binding protein